MILVEVDDIAISVQCCRNDCQAAKDVLFAKVFNKGVNVLHTIEYGQDKGFFANSCRKVVNAILQTVGFTAEDNQVKWLNDLIFGEVFDVRNSDVAMGTLNMQAICFFELGNAFFTE